MKRNIFLLLSFILSLVGCKDEIEYSTNVKLNLYNVSKTEVTFIDGRIKNQTVNFDIFVSKTSSKEIAVTLNLNGNSTAEENAQYKISSTQFTIPAGSLKASGTIDFYYDGFVNDESKLLSYTLKSNSFDAGLNDTLSINVGKITNPLISVFKGDFIGHYWSITDEEEVGNYDQGGGDDIILFRDTTDTEAQTLKMYNLWAGADTLTVTFDFDKNTIHMDAGQIIDPVWPSTGFTPPWSIEEVNGTYSATDKKMVFDMTIVDVDGNVYDSYTFWVFPKEE